MYSIMNNMMILVSITFSYLVYVFLKITKKKTQQEKYQELLESPKKYKFGDEKINDIPLDNNLVKIISNFILEHDLYQNGVIVSLSGGVDSMVILAILLRLKKERESLGKSFPIFTSTINYNLRVESKDEADFIKDYCQQYSIVTRTEHLNGTVSVGNKRGLVSANNQISKRSEFEEESKNIRYQSYQNIIDEYKCNGVMVGHHGDDIIENIFTNSMKGHNLLDIEVMKKKSNIRGIDIYRPLLDNRKSEIYEIAHTYNIPYFLDTTPKWSRRGKMRNEIFPLFTQVFGASWKNKFKEIGTQSNNWNDTVQKFIIEPWFQDVYYGKYGFKVPIKHTEDINLWIYALPKLFFKIDYGTIKKRTIVKIVKMIKDGDTFSPTIILDSGFRCFIQKNNLIVYQYSDLENNFKIKSDVEDNINNFLNGIGTNKKIINNIKKIINN